MQGFRAINCATDSEALIDEIATADVVTTAVGPNILKFVAPLIAAGLARRAGAQPRDRCRLAGRFGARHLREYGRRPHRAQQAADAGLTVTVEAFYEWVIERGPFGDAVPVIPGATFVDNLLPYIERKLFTVNTGHATGCQARTRRCRPARLP